MKKTVSASQTTGCYHCGDAISSPPVFLEDKKFCCQGCKMVYEIINQHQLCDYYTLNENPGATQKIKVREGKFSFLDEPTIIKQLIDFQDDQEINICFNIPQMHCSSCLYLLEHLYKIDPAIVSSKVNFTDKELRLVFDKKKTSLRKVAELLTAIGYEPYISLNQLSNKKLPADKSLIYKLGIAGFCFGNIMLMSFPEYFGIDANDLQLQSLFRWINFILALPVVIYSATPFYTSSLKSLKHRFLNIDAPIALAVLITFGRSCWKLFTDTGSGYFDSMTGIVFFMLAGRVLQDKTYRQLSFERDYTSYFPVTATVIGAANERFNKPLPEIKPGDTLIIHNEELITADGILSKGRALIDYSFVTGESIPVAIETGEMIYAGGKQKAGAIEIVAMKPVSQSYLTSLWNNEVFKKEDRDDERSFVHLVSRYFTYAVFSIALVAGVYWYMADESRLWPSVTAVFIVACPCALLLSNSFTNGNILAILGRNKLYLRNAQTIEQLAQASHIIFDKTGTLTTNDKPQIRYEGTALRKHQIRQCVQLAACSSHPLSKALVNYFDMSFDNDTLHFKEEAGKGIKGWIDEQMVMLGSSEFVTGQKQADSVTAVYFRIDNKVLGRFVFNNQYRQGLAPLVSRLKHQFHLSVLSGDNSSESAALQKIFGSSTELLFNQGPEDKLNYIKELQLKGHKVIMIGDGLNDAGALKQSDAGIAITEDSNNFTPASDAILSAEKLSQLDKLVRLCVANKKIVTASFIMSILYNIIGLCYAVTGNLSPLIAAILMPASSLSILLLTFGGSNLIARKLKLR